MKETNVRERVSLTKRILGIFGIKIDSLPSSSILEDESICVRIPTDYNCWKSAETALLEAEREKTEALMQRQRRSFLC